MEKLKQSKLKMFIYVVIIVAVAFCGNWLYKGRKVQFEDDMMRQVICLELGKDKDSQDVTYRDLESIEELHIGALGMFETIEDVAKCKNLKTLGVNELIQPQDASFELYEIAETGERYYPPYPSVSEEKMQRMQKDLEKILKSDRKIEEFGFTNVNDSFDILNMKFLKYGKNIKDIDISYSNIKDYSVLENCSNLQSIDLWYSDIDSADDLLELKYVNRLILTGTPLAQNEKEIVKLKKAFPEAEIVVD